MGDLHEDFIRTDLFLGGVLCNFARLAAFEDGELNHDGENGKFV